MSQAPPSPSKPLSKKRSRSGKEATEESAFKKRARTVKFYGYPEAVFDNFPPGLIDLIVSGRKPRKIREVEEFKEFTDGALFWEAMFISHVVLPLKKALATLKGFRGLEPVPEGLRQRLERAIERLAQLYGHCKTQGPRTQDSIGTFWQSAATEMVVAAGVILHKGVNHIIVGDGDMDAPGITVDVEHDGHGNKSLYWYLDAGKAVGKEYEVDQDDLTIEVGEEEGDTKMLTHWSKVFLTYIMEHLEEYETHRPAELTYVLSGPSVIGLNIDAVDDEDPAFRVSVGLSTGFIPLPMDYFRYLKRVCASDPLPSEKSEAKLYCIPSPDAFVCHRENYLQAKKEILTSMLEKASARL